MNMTKKLVFFLCLLFSNCACSMKVADVRLENNNAFEIKSGDAVIGHFAIEIKKDGRVVRQNNESISFIIKLKDLELGKNSPNSCKLKCSPEGGMDQEVDLVVENGKCSTKNIHITLGKSFYSQKKNNRFSLILRFQLIDSPVVFDEVKLVVVPEISISVDRNTVDFGTLIYDNNRVYGGEDKYVIVNYTVFNDGACLISSKNGFSLKHSDGSSIKYNIGNGELTPINDRTKTLNLEAHKTVYSLKFNIDYYCRNMPSAGDYGDSLIVQISSNE